MSSADKHAAKHRDTQKETTHGPSKDQASSLFLTDY